MWISKPTPSFNAPFARGNIVVAICALFGRKPKRTPTWKIGTCRKQAFRNTCLRALSIAAPVRTGRLLVPLGPSYSDNRPFFHRKLRYRVGLLERLLMYPCPHRNPLLQVQLLYRPDCSTPIACTFLGVNEMEFDCAMGFWALLGQTQNIHVRQRVC